MILWSSKPDPETRPGFPCTAFRWAVEYRGDPPTFGVVHQNQSGGEWDSSHTLFYGLAVCGPLRWGIHHDYYDGPHCSLNIGWIKILWGGDPRTGWCYKCMPRGE